jgi:hypothetical protein
MQRDFDRATLHFQEEMRLRPTQKFGGTEIPSGMKFLVDMCRAKEYPVLFHEQVMQGDLRIQTVLFLACAYGEAGQHEKSLGLLRRVLKGEFEDKNTLPVQTAYAKYEEAEMCRLLLCDKEAVAGFKTFLEEKNAGFPMIIVLHTNLLPKDQGRDWVFLVGSGKEPVTRIVSSQRHNNTPWVVDYADSTSERIVAKSAPVPKGDSTNVVVIGRFAKATKPPANPGGGGSGQPAAPVQLITPVWRSIVKAPGVHIILVNQYNVQSDMTDIPKELPLLSELNSNAVMALCATELGRPYQGEGSRVIMVRCGLRGNIRMFAERRFRSLLPRYSPERRSAK